MALNSKDVLLQALQLPPNLDDEALNLTSYSEILSEAIQRH